MGKCSGLKGGGHHRKAIDVAEKKKNEKAARKKEQAASGKRAVVLKEILAELDPDCDLYIDAVICDGSSSAGSGGAKISGMQQLSTSEQELQIPTSQLSHAKHNKNSTGLLPDLCRAHFRHDAAATSGASFLTSIPFPMPFPASGKNINNSNDDDGPQTLPALRHLPGILGMNRQRKKNVRRPVPRSSEDGPRSVLEEALGEGSSALDRIVACLDSDRDAVRLGMTCRYLCHRILDGDGCPDVQRRKYRALERKLERRNAVILANKSLAGGLRYAVLYTASANVETKPKMKRTKNGNSKHRRPMLIFDYENPHVYAAYRLIIANKSRV
eukprot:CAMPEP_0181082144 /NCGR_PEP_ID=MMETSP1071-20121207/3467_1 /TAXON_ID=35127 /ORGANISM="Thalassiosira sp., Strain NH16" /LENGTH=327 /DNA_ID=CAMNT_0023163715 /DNA_START=14 /DNA_END=998 /DNA_ORIENTATION=-